MKIKDVRSMKLTMQLKSRSYDIILKAGCLANLHQFTNVANRKVFVLTDSGVPAEYAQTVAAQCPDSTVYTIPRGEGSKCLKVYGQVLQAMLAFGMDRKDLLVSVGGGVVGDLGGFCAASYMRGIDFVNCPTTVLSQVDSSIGGKTAIDLGETKNIVGAFWQPKVVLVDFDTLKTLPRRQVVNGLAEALKTGIIGDPQLFALFECEHPEDNIEQIVYRSLKFKKKIVEQDEREGSVRACLNFGHTIGHGTEAVRGARGRGGMLCQTNSDVISVDILCFPLHQFADHLAHLRRVRFSFHLLHDLSHEESDDFIFSFLQLSDRFRVCVQDLFHGLLEKAGIAFHLQSVFLHIGRRIHVGLEHRGEHLFRSLVIDHTLFKEFDQCCQMLCGKDDL